jgi:ankyrin repeat protein
VLARLDHGDPVRAEDLDRCFWSACHGGRLETAQVLAERGADIDWLPSWEDATPLDIAAREGAHDVVSWLHRRGAHTCDELGDRS